MSYKIRGQENIPVNGPVLVAANHLSVADPVLIGVSLGRRITFMAKEELFKNRLSAYFVRQFGAFPIHKGSSNREALRQAHHILSQGKMLGMFPEGKRSKTGTLMTAMDGTAMVAYHNKALILPIGITGTERVRGFGWIFNRPDVYLVIGQPFSLPDTGKSLTREQLTNNTGIIMQRIAGLLPEQYHGEYAGRLQ